RREGKRTLGCADGSVASSVPGVRLDLRELRAVPVDVRPVMPLIKHARQAGYSEAGQGVVQAPVVDVTPAARRTDGVAAIGWCLRCPAGAGEPRLRSANRKSEGHEPGGFRCLAFLAEARVEQLPDLRQ